MRFAVFTTMLLSLFKLYQCIKYDNYGVYNVHVTNRQQMMALRSMAEEKYLKVEFWTKPFKVNSSVQILANRNEEGVFLERMNHFSLQYDLIIPNLQKAFDNQTLKKYPSPNVDELDWNAYYDLEDINQWLQDLAIKYSKEADLLSIGKSAEQRILYALRIHKGNADRDVIVEAGLDGREWVSTVVATYIIAKLLQDRSSGDTNWRSLVKKYNWYIIPVANPDGFKYTHTEDRLWKKNRRDLSSEILRRRNIPQQDLNKTRSYGVDLNKNFNISFATRSTNVNPNDPSYSGESPMSEPETWSLSEFIKSRRKNLKFYYCLRAYGQKIVVPYAESVQHVDNYLHLARFARTSAERLFGVQYEVGTYYDIFGESVSGSSASWVKKTFNIDYVYEFYLRDNGTFGYALPADQLEPACQEALAAITAIMSAKFKRVGRSGSFQIDKAPATSLNDSLTFCCTMFSILWMI